MLRLVTGPRALSAAALLVLAGGTSAHAQMRVDARIHTSAGSCVACDLSQKSMTRLRLRDADFSNSNFYRSNLSGGRFDGTNLSGAVFSKAYLIKAEGERVDLTNAVLRDATLTHASLRRSRFASADLRRADLTSGRFEGSDFVRADMSSVIARGAVFADADLTGARLPMANLSEADLSGATLSGADLRDAQGLTQEQLDTACGDGETRLPDGLYIGYCEAELAATALMAESAVVTTAARASVHDHSRAVEKLDTAITEIETILESETEPATRRRLERVHSQIVSSRQELR